MMKTTRIGLLVAGAAALASAIEVPRQALEFSEVEVGGELQVRLERNFGRLHARRYSEPVLFTETADPKWPGDDEGRTGLALVLGAQALRIDTPGIDSLMGAFPKYYNKQGYFGALLDPAFDKLEGSWRQLLFPRRTPATKQ